MRRVLLVVVAVAFATGLFLLVEPEPARPAPQVQGPPPPVAAAVAEPARAAKRPSVGPAEAPDPAPQAETVDAGQPLLGAPPPLVLEALSLDAGLALAEDVPPSAPDGSARARVRDARFGVRWDEPGLCGDEPLAAIAQRRAALLASFASVHRAGTTVFFEPGVPAGVIDAVSASLLDARTILLQLVGSRADVPFPRVYVYETAERLRSVACVNSATAGYYDGAIHLPADDPDARRTVIHEVTHHVLNALGVRKPMWLHEGLAMYAADERWWADPRSGLVVWLRREHLPFRALVEAFPHTADELFAGAVYYQSFQMVRFVGARAGQPDFGWLVEAIATGQLGVDDAFEGCLGLSETAIEAEWRGFILAG